MTTNSPNPVDGDVDVQALIEHIEKWKSGETRNDSISDFNKFQRKIYELALAALTAKPGLFEWRFKETDTPASGWLTLPMEKLDRSKAVFGDLVEYRFWFESPPAQLLRPAELPEPYDDGHGNLWLPQDAVISAVKKAGYEVKS